MKLSLVLPAYNEAGALPRVIPELYRAFELVEPSFEIVIVDNGSDDDTPAVLRDLEKQFPNVTTVRVYPNRGFGYGVRQGLLKARGGVVGWAGADGQLIAAEVVKVYNTLIESGRPFVKGERIQSIKDPARKVQSICYTTLFRLVFGPLSTDVNGTPKFLARDLYQRLDLESDDWFLDSESILKAAYLGERPLEVPVLWKQREHGYSKVNIKATLQFLKNVFNYWNKKK